MWNVCDLDIANYKSHVIKSSLHTIRQIASKDFSNLIERTGWCVNDRYYMLWFYYIALKRYYVFPSTFPASLVAIIVTRELALRRTTLAWRTLSCLFLSFLFSLFLSLCLFCRSVLLLTLRISQLSRIPPASFTTYERSAAPATLPFIIARICMRMYWPMRKRIKLEFTVRLAASRDAAGPRCPVATRPELSAISRQIRVRTAVRRVSIRFGNKQGGEWRRTSIINSSQPRPWRIARGLCRIIQARKRVRGESRVILFARDLAEQLNSSRAPSPVPRTRRKRRDSRG